MDPLKHTPTHAHAHTRTHTHTHTHHAFCLALTFKGACFQETLSPFFFQNGVIIGVMVISRIFIQTFLKYMMTSLQNRNNS